MELAVFRLIQESLTNIHRHSGSNVATIRVSREGHNVCIEVEDRGRGMSAEKLQEIQARGSGVGIRGMRERIRQFQGEMTIQSNSPGTRITVILPITTQPLSKPASPEPLTAVG
jgi:signal transduction histidine kinase